MKVPNKFWFYHCSDKNSIYFAEGDEYRYVISGGDVKHPNSRTPDEVESYFQKGYWVLTVPSEFKVRGLFAGTIYFLSKDANNLYVMGVGQTTFPGSNSEEEVLDSLYGEDPVWEVYTEEKVEEQIKEQTTPDTFKFRHWSDCEHNGTIFSAIRCKDGYMVGWADVDTGESRKIMYSNSDVEHYLSGGDWIIVEEDVVKEKAPVKKLISINVNSVRATAEFDVANNKHTIKKNLSVEEIEQEVLKYVREMYSSLMSGEFEWESRAIGTRSYTVRFQVEDENYGVISVEVDPSIGMPSFYASVEDFLNQN